MYDGRKIVKVAASQAPGCIMCAKRSMKLPDLYPSKRVSACATRDGQENKRAFSATAGFSQLPAGFVGSRERKGVDAFKEMKSKIRTGMIVKLPDENSKGSRFRPTKQILTLTSGDDSNICDGCFEWIL